MTAAVKICGISEPETARAAAEAGAKYIGLVFYDRSPRAVTTGTAREIVEALPKDVQPVGLFVDPDDALLKRVTEAVPLSMIQLHGKESPARVAQVRKAYGLPVLKAVTVGDAFDVDAARLYEGVADWMLFDARPPVDGALPGGNGIAFDWSLLAGRTWSKPWMLSGGLTPWNVAQAIRVTGAAVVDVSSGVEDGPGCKNCNLIRQFIAAATGKRL